MARPSIASRRPKAPQGGQEPPLKTDGKLASEAPPPMEDQEIQEPQPAEDNPGQNLIPDRAPTHLFHGTSTAALKNIRKDMFLRAKSDFGSERIARYYAEEAAEETGTRGVVLKLPIGRFQMQSLQPDTNSLDEPLTYTLRTHEDTVWEKWEESSGTWLDCYDIVESVRYHAHLRLEPEDFKDFME